MATALRKAYTPTIGAGAGRNQRTALPVSRRQRKRRNALIFRSVLAGLLLVFSLGYIGLYAQVTLYGYRRAELGRQIRQIEMENQALEAEIQTLSSPERVSALAVQSGMKPRDDVVYISPSESISVALAR